MLKRGILSLAAAAVLFSTPAFALFEAHGLVGKRWYEHEDDVNSQATIVAVDGYLTLPVPVITLGIGPGIEYNMVNKGDVGYDPVDSATIMKLAGKVLVGFSLVGTGLDIYGKLGFTLWGDGEYKGKYIGLDDEEVSGTTEFSVSGTTLAVGLRYSLLPLVGLLFEAQMGQEKFTDVKVDDTEIDDIDANSTALLLGVNIGI